MKAAELRELLKENKDWCAQEARSLRAPILEKMAQVIFPAGTQPNETEPLNFSEREQIIIREQIFDAEEIHGRVLSAMMGCRG